MKYKLSIFSLICAASGIVYFSDGIAKEYDSAIPSQSFTEGNIYICDEQNNCKDMLEVGFNSLASYSPPLEMPPPRQIHCLAQNIYWEARGEPKEAQIAVAFATIERVNKRGYPDTLCGVVFDKRYSKRHSRYIYQMSWVPEYHKGTLKKKLPIPEKYKILANQVLYGKYEKPPCGATNWFNPRTSASGSFNERKIDRYEYKCTYILKDSDHVFLEYRK